MEEIKNRHGLRGKSYRIASRYKDTIKKSCEMGPMRNGSRGDRGYTADGRGHKTGNDDIRESVGKFSVGANAITKMTALRPE